MAWLIDRAVAIPYPAPRSYTGEDMLELMVHGSPWIVRATIEAFTAAGARPAEPGRVHPPRGRQRQARSGPGRGRSTNSPRPKPPGRRGWLGRRSRDGCRANSPSSRMRSPISSPRLEAALDFAHHDIPYDRAGGRLSPRPMSGAGEEALGHRAGRAADPRRRSGRDSRAAELGEIDPLQSPRRATSGPSSRRTRARPGMSSRPSSRWRGCG